jgi:hypothetical protein
MRLTFVYNANSDVFSKIFDAAHKIIHPTSYGCSLCTLTHGYFGEKQEWQDFLKDADIEFEFMYKDGYESKEQFPIMLKNNEMLLSAKEIDSFKSVEEFIAYLMSLEA